MPLPIQNLDNDLISWTASCSMRGQYSGSVNLVNHEDQYGDSLLSTVFKVSLDSSNVSASVGIDKTCLTGLSDWINGVIYSVEDVIPISNKNVRLSIKSFFARLSRKAVNTERYENISVSVVLADLMNTFGGVPASLFDFTGVGVGNVVTMVSGNNMLEEMKKLSQVAGSDLFVQKDGKLLAEVWKDNNSPIDIIIPNESIRGVVVQRSIDIVPTRITVRGRFISSYDAGEMHFSGPDTPGTQDPGDNGSEQLCYQNGIKTQQQNISLNNVRGNRTDHRNMRFVLTVGTPGMEVARIGNQLNNTIGNIGRGLLNVAIRQSSGAMNALSRNNNLELVGRRRPVWEWLSPNTTFVPHRGNKRQDGKVMGFTGIKRTEGGVNLSLDLSSQNDSDKNADEPDPIRIEMVVDDPDLQDEFGVVHSQIDNLYLSDFDQMFNAAIRKFQEFKMQRRSWRVETVYLPCLELNQVVQFTTPDTLETVIGLITDIRINFDPAPRAQMSLIIEDFKDIGATIYTSDNMLFYPDLDGVDGTFSGIGWSVRVSPVFMHKGYAGIGSGGVLQQTINVKAGDSYSLTFDVQEPASGGSVIVSVIGSGLSPAGPSGGGSPGSHTVDFTASIDTTASIGFTGTGNGGFLLKPKLTRQTIA